MNGSINAAQSPIKDLSKCHFHTRNEVVYLCTEFRCSGEVACIDCVTSVHQGHKLVKLQDVVEEKRAKIRSRIEEIKKNEKQELLLEIRNVDAKLNNNLQMSDYIVNDIQEQSRKCKEGIDEAAKFITKACTNVFQQNLKDLNEYKMKLQIQIKEMDKTLQKMLDTVESGSNISVHVLSKNLQIPEFKLPKTVTLKEVAYIPNRLPSMSESIRLLCTVSTQKCNEKQTVTSMASPNENPVSLSEFQLQGFANIFVTSDGHCIVWKEGLNQLWLVTNTGKLKRKINMDPIKPLAICLSRDDNFWMICNDRSVRRVTVTDSIVVVFCIETEGQFRDLAITNENNVLVASNKGITLYNRHGETLCTTEMNKSGEPTLKSLYSMYECSKNGLVVVLDQNETPNDGKHYPMLVAFNSDLKFRFCCMETVNDVPFFPSAFAFDDAGNVLVTNASTQSVVMLSPDGHYVKNVVQIEPTWYPIQIILRNGVLWMNMIKSKKRLFLKSSSDVMAIKCFHYGIT